MKTIYRKIALLALPFTLLASEHSECTKTTQQQCPIPSVANVITSPVNPVVCDSWNVFFNADYLYMTAFEGGLPYARQISELGAFGSHESRECYEVDPGWNSGFRVGIGYNLDHDHWDTLLSWTWMLNKGSDKKSDAVNQLFSLNAMPGIDSESGLIANTFESKIKIHLNAINWQIGREFFLSKWLKVRPFPGIKTAWVHQKWDTKAYGDIIAMNNSLSEYFVKIKQEFWGIGPMIGINTEWGLVSHFSLYANASFSILSAYLNDSRNDQGVQFPSGIKINNPFFKKSWQAAPATEMQFGFRWNEWFCRKRTLLTLQAGWDALLFSNHVHWFAINGQSNSTGTSFGQTQHLGEIGGDLLFQGLSVSLALTF